MRLGVSGFWGLLRMEDGMGERGQVIFMGTGMFCFPGVGERLGIQLGVDEHSHEMLVVEGY